MFQAATCAIRLLPSAGFARGINLRCLSSAMTADVLSLNPAIVKVLVKAGMFGDGPIATIVTGLILSNSKEMP